MIAHFNLNSKYKNLILVWFKEFCDKIKKNVEVSEWWDKHR